MNKVPTLILTFVLVLSASICVAQPKITKKRASPQHTTPSPQKATPVPQKAQVPPLGDACVESFKFNQYMTDEIKNNKFDEIPTDLRSMGFPHGQPFTFCAISGQDRKNALRWVFESGKVYCLLATNMDKTCQNMKITIDGATPDEIKFQDHHNRFIDITYFAPSSNNVRAVTASFESSQPVHYTLSIYEVGSTLTLDTDTMGSLFQLFANSKHQADKDGWKPIRTDAGWFFCVGLTDASSNLGFQAVWKLFVPDHVRVDCFADSGSEYYEIGGTDGGNDLPVGIYDGRFEDKAHKGEIIRHEYPYETQINSLGVHNLYGKTSLIGVAIYSKH